MSNFNFVKHLVENNGTGNDLNANVLYAGVQLSKLDEDGLKLTNLNRNNPALLQYAMTNYGTTQLSAEDWKKCEDNFKINLLYQVNIICYCIVL